MHEAKQVWSFLSMCETCSLSPDAFDEYSFFKKKKKKCYVFFIIGFIKGYKRKETFCTVKRKSTVSEYKVSM